MPFSKLSLVFLLGVSPGLQASGGGGDGGGAAEEGAAPAAPMPKDQREFVEKTSKLTTLTNRIENWEKVFKELVHKKNAATSTEEKQSYIREMVDVTKERNKDVDQYTKIKMELAYRYPNQGEHLNRRYKTQTKRSIEELEGVAGLDEMLTRTKKVVEKKFAPFDVKDEKRELLKPEPTSSTSAPKHGEEPPKRLRLEK